MNTKIKLLLGTAALVVVIGGSYVLLQTLSKTYTPQDLLEPATTASQDSEPAGSPTGEEETSASQPEKLVAPDFSMEDEEGNTVKLSDFLGKPVVINVWASWCPPCKAEMPDFQKVWEEMGEEVEFLMLNSTDGGRETKETAQAFIAKEGFTFPVYFDTAQEATYTYGIYSLPTTLFIDKDGYLVTGTMGMIDEATLRKGIELIMTSEEEQEQAETAEYHKMTAAEAKEQMDTSDDYILLDVRTQEEFDERRIDGAILIPDTEISERAEAELPDKDALILVYCRSGRRSELAARKLVEMGYVGVYDFGGIHEWPFDTVP